MNPLIYVVVAMVVASFAVTIISGLSAVEGYQDEKGFHPLRSIPLFKARKPKLASVNPEKNSTALRPWSPVH